MDLQKKAPAGRGTFSESLLESNRRKFGEAVSRIPASPQTGSNQPRADFKNYSSEEDENSKRFEPRAFGAIQNRKTNKPSAKLQDYLLDKYERRCAYCRHKLGDAIRKQGEITYLALHWDHFVPFADGRANTNPENWLPTCHVCNQIKGANSFDSLEQAATFIMKARIRKGYSPP